MDEVTFFIPLSFLLFIILIDKRFRTKLWTVKIISVTMIKQQMLRHRRGKMMRSQVREELKLWSGLSGNELRANLRTFASALLGQHHRHQQCTAVLWQAVVQLVSFCRPVAKSFTLAPLTAEPPPLININFRITWASIFTHFHPILTAFHFL